MFVDREMPIGFKYLNCCNIPDFLWKYQRKSHNFSHKIVNMSSNFMKSHQNEGKMSLNKSKE